MKATKLWIFPLTTTATSSPCTLLGSSAGPYSHDIFAKRVSASPSGGTTLASPVIMISAHPQGNFWRKILRTSVLELPTHKICLNSIYAFRDAFMPVEDAFRPCEDSILVGVESFDCLVPFGYIFFAEDSIEIVSNDSGCLFYCCHVEMYSRSLH